MFISRPDNLCFPVGLCALLAAPSYACFKIISENECYKSDSRHQPEPQQMEDGNENREKGIHQFLLKSKEFHSIELKCKDMKEEIHNTEVNIDFLLESRHA